MRFTLKKDKSGVVVVGVEGQLIVGNRQELKQKGVSEEVLREALTATNDDEAAYTLAAKRAPRLAGLEKQDFRRKLGEFLARRGFNYDTIEPVVERVWRESQTGSADE